MSGGWFFALGAFGLGVLSGGTASIVGFGIGSLMTPFFATWVGMDVAVAGVTLPHLCATALRCWRMRQAIDRGVLVRFGLLSAVGGLGGALAYAKLGPTTLGAVLGGLLVLTAVANLTGVFTRMQPKGAVVAAFGLASGFFGGIAGNHGGLRSAALTAFSLTPAAFVATSTATGLLVDLARTPVYAAVSASALWAVRWPLVSATAGVLVGTIAGERILFGLSPATFRRVLSAAVGLLGVWMLARALL